MLERPLLQQAEEFGVPFTPDTASDFAEKLNGLLWYQILLSGFFSLLIFVLIFFFAIRYRRRHKDEWPGHQKESMKLELVWSTLPGALALVMFFWGAALYVELKEPPEEGLEIYAVGKQWMWKVQHPEGRREINALHVPIGQPVKMTLASEDVIHSFFVPAFRVKMDAVPGRYTQLWFTPTKVGEYHLFCAEYCGTEHSQMIGTVSVLEPAEFERWLAGGADESMASTGAKLFQRMACNTCHAADGSGRGPSLVGIFGEPVQLQDGRTLPRDEAYLRESILEPAQKLVAGYQNLMPTFSAQLGEAEILELIAYIRSRKGSADGGADEQ